MGHKNKKKPKYQPKVIEVFTHPDYNQYTEENSIALLQLSEPYRYKSAKPVALPISSDDDDSLISVSGTVSGWGKSKTLKYVTGIILDKMCCRRYFGGLIKDSQFCLEEFEEDPDDNCNSDIGSPLVVTKYGGLLLVGIATYENCESQIRNVFTSIPAHMNWINSIIGTC